jgi:hypothetical protein
MDLIRLLAKNSTVSCPLCKASTKIEKGKSLPINYIAQSLVDVLMQQTKTPICGMKII